ncbi:MAG: replicative DNA helicase [Bacillota bacterium]|nr:replicative DNA helicase [Bacillota bacterium]
MITAKEEIGKTPPYSQEAERAVLGACMLDAQAANAVREVLRPRDFYVSAHQLIFSCIERMVDDAQPCDPVTVCDSLRSRGDLERVGGAAYVAGLLDSVPSPSAALHYAAIVTDKAQVRALLDVAAQINSGGYEGGFGGGELLELAERAVFEVSEGRRHGDFFALPELLSSTYIALSEMQNVGGVTGIPTFPDLDNQYLSGLHKSDLIILAARPGMGKTSMAINIAQNAAARHGKVVAVFSLEMPKEQLVQRMLCTEAEVDHSRARRGGISKDDFARLKKAVERLSSAQMYIDDTMSVSIGEMRSKLRKLKMERGLDLVVVDYIQLMQGGSGSRRAESRQLEVAEISRSLKAMAKELDIPVLALSQLSRLAERSNEPPNLSHLRESGALEQDADVVILLHQPKPAGEGDAPLNDEASMKQNTDGDKVEVIVAKHRNGPCGTAEMIFIKQYTAFRSNSERWIGDKDAPPPGMGDDDIF